MTSTSCKLCKDGERISVPLKIEHYEFIKKTFSLDMAEIQDELKNMPPIFYEKILTDRAREVIHHLRTDIFVDRKTKSKSIKYEYPATWWQHLKYDIIKSWPGSIRRLFRLNMNDVKMKTKRWDIEFIKDYFPDKPGWHKQLFHNNREGRSVQIKCITHEEIQIDESR